MTNPFESPKVGSEPPEPKPLPEPTPLWQGLLAAVILALVGLVHFPPLGNVIGIAFIGCGLLVATLSLVAAANRRVTKKRLESLKDQEA